LPTRERWAWEVQDRRSRPPRQPGESPLLKPAYRPAAGVHPWAAPACPRPVSPAPSVLLSLLPVVGRWGCGRAGRWAPTRRAHRQQRSAALRSAACRWATRGASADPATNPNSPRRCGLWTIGYSSGSRKGESTGRNSRHTLRSTPQMCRGERPIARRRYQ